MSEVRNNQERSRYELFVDGERIGTLTYRDDGDTVVAWHTEIQDSHGSHGRGQELVRAALDDIRAQGKHVQPLCPFVKAYIDKHSEQQDLVKGS